MQGQERLAKINLIGMIQVESIGDQSLGANLVLQYLFWVPRSEQIQSNSLRYAGNGNFS